MSNPNLLVIVGSTRPGRVGRPVADWFLNVAREHGGFDVHEADLLEIGLPLLDEPKHPRFKDYTHEHTKRWSAIVEAADVIVWVTPEYNHSYPASLKNAIDYLHQEWSHKPLGFVSYGGIAAGTRAMQALKPVASALALMPAVNAVNIAFVHQKLQDGAFVGGDAENDAAKLLLDELLHLESGLSVIRKPAA